MSDTLVVVAPNWLGDAVMALPAIADVRRARPDARLVIAARASVASLFRMVPSVDDVLTLEWRGRLTGWAALRGDRAQLEQARASTVILLPNSFATAWLVRRAGIRERWGYARDLRRPLLTRAVRIPRGSLHQGRYYQHLVQELGFASGPLEPSVVPPTEAIESVRAMVTNRPIVVIAPGAAYGTAKRWLPAHFSRLIDTLVTTSDAQCVLVGSHADAVTTREVRSGVSAAAAAHVVDLTGRTTLAMLAALLRLARVCVSNDSGTMHLAAAVGVPVAAIFGPTREHETAPLPHAGVRADVLINPVWCRPCMLRECPIDHRCMRGIDPQRVHAVVSEMLGTAT